MTTKNSLYILILNNKKKVSIKVGSKGEYIFLPGTYFYVGSARNNLEKRIARHLSSEKKMHWHIDYITQYMTVEKVLGFKNVDFSECELADAIVSMEDISTVYKGIGSSDCKCFSHFFILS